MHIAAVFVLALLLGGMVFFAAVMAPLVFTQLPGAVAGRFIRAVFPFYYLYVLIAAAAGAVLLLPGPAAVAMAAVALATLWLRQWLMPRLNRLSDAMRSDDATRADDATQAGGAMRLGKAAAKRRFDRGHRLSVIVNFAQMLAVAAVLAQLAG